MSFWHSKWKFYLCDVKFNCMVTEIKTGIIIVVFLIVSLLMACSGSQSNNGQLVLADSLMQSRPDSALQILQDIPIEKFATQTDSAYYALLLTQARDKNYIVQTSDSLIRYAVAYYDKVNDVPMQAKAHYYWGCVYRDKGEHQKAIDEYSKAETLAKKENNQELPALIYSNIAYLYYIHDLNTEADSVYQLAVKLAIQQKDTASLIYALSQQGMIDFEKGGNFYPEAERQMRRALSLAEHFTDTTVKSPIYASLSTLYCKMDDAKMALDYAKLNYYSQRDTLYCYRTFLLLGEAYFQNSQYDLAVACLRKVFSAERYYVTKADACKLLAEIAEIRGDISGIAEMKGKQISYMDSAHQKYQKYDILQSIILQERNKNQNAHNKDVYSIVVLFFIVLSACFLIVLKYVKRDRKHQINEEIKKQKLQVDVDFLMSRKQALLKEEYENSVIYIRLKNITRTLGKIETKENINEEDWRKLIALTDLKWNGIITYLNTAYCLSAEDIQICCLYLAEIPVKHIGHFIKGYARSTIQLKARDITHKIGASQGSLLKSVLLALSEKLKSNQ